MPRMSRHPEVRAVFGEPRRTTAAALAAILRGAQQRAPRDDGCGCGATTNPSHLIPAIALDARIGVDDAAVDRDGGADHVVSGARGEIDRGARHVLICTNAP